MDFYNKLFFIIIYIWASIGNGLCQISREEQIAAAKEFADNCERYGGSGTYSNVMMKVQTFQQCLMGAINQMELQRLLTSSEANNNGDELVSYVCVRSYDLKQCIDGLLDAMGSCFDYDGKKSLKIFIGVFHNTIDYVCEDKGQHVKDFLKDGGLECIKSKKPDFQQCQAQVAPEAQAIASSPKFDNARCKIFDTLSKCVHNTVLGCKPHVAEFIDGVVGHALEGVPCTNGTYDATKGSGNQLSGSFGTLLLLVPIYLFRFM